MLGLYSQHVLVSSIGYFSPKSREDSRLLSVIWGAVQTGAADEVDATDRADPGLSLDGHRVRDRTAKLRTKLRTTKQG